MTDANARFWDRIARKYSRQPVADEAAYQHKLELTQRYLKADAELLEIGCGTGSTALVHAAHVAHIRAVDISHEMLEIAREKARNARVNNVTFERGTLETIEAAPQSIDVLLALSVLHLLDDPDAAIRRIHDLVKPGGVFVSSTACLSDSWLRYLGLVLPVGRWLGKLPMVRILSADRLTSSIRHAGFQIEYEWRPKPTAALFVVARKMS